MKVKKRRPILWGLNHIWASSGELMRREWEVRWSVWKIKCEWEKASERERERAADVTHFWFDLKAGQDLIILMNSLYLSNIDIKFYKLLGVNFVHIQMKGIIASHVVRARMASHRPSWVWCWKASVPSRDPIDFLRSRLKRLCGKFPADDASRWSENVKQLVSVEFSVVMCCEKPDLTTGISSGYVSKYVSN